MSKEIIKVLEYLGEKIGLAIDWSAANVYPQVMEVLGRYRTMSIVRLTLALLLSIAFMVLGVRLYKTLKADRALCASKERDTRFFDHRYYGVSLNDWNGVWMIVGIGSAFVTALTICLCVIGPLLRWMFVPELQYYNLLASMIRG